MPKNELPPLANLLHAFFYDWLEEQRDASRCTVIAYRDAWRLFLRFVAGRHKRPVAALQFDHLSQSEVLAFLHHLEHERHASITTRNCRLAALRSFFSFVADREPLAVRQCADILRVPFKRAPVPAMKYLEPVEATALLEEPDRSTPKGQRDHVLLSLLYNTGARIQEVLSLRPQDICLKPLPYVRLMGKGKKERITPIWPETVSVLEAFMRDRNAGANEPLFLNKYGMPLGAAGFRFCLHKYVQSATAKVSSLSQKRVTPHLFRHTTGVRLLAAGVDSTVIRNWLGHAHLDTTNRYARANLDTLRKALEQADSKPRTSKPPRWKREAGLLAWLESL
jgi:site-specific recombinase XerD